MSIVAPGASREYQIGGAWLATRTATPVVPVAHNSGEVWRRKAFLKYPGTITVSIGIAQNKEEESIEEFLRRADAAMYEAKRAGRDRIVVAGSAPR